MEAKLKSLIPLLYDKADVLLRYYPSGILKAVGYCPLCPSSQSPGREAAAPPRFCTRALYFTVSKLLFKHLKKPIFFRKCNHAVFRLTTTNGLYIFQNLW